MEERVGEVWRIPHPDIYSNESVILLSKPLPIEQFMPACHARTIRTLTSNANYFAYSSKTTAVIFDAKTKKSKAVISKRDTSISTIRFANGKSPLLGVAFCDNTTSFFDISKMEKVVECVSPGPMVSLTWFYGSGMCAGFTHSIDTLRFCTPQEPGCTWREVPVLLPPMAQTYCHDVNGNHIMIGADKTGEMYWIDLTASDMKTFQENGKHIVSICGDPLNPANCLVCWKEGQWGLFDAYNGLSLIKKCDVGGGNEFAAAVWLKHPPGLFVIGLAKFGILKLWTTTGDAPLDSVTLNGAGVRQMDVLGNGDLLIAFADGRVIAYSWKKKRIVWDARGGHTSTINGIQFSPTHSNEMVTSSAGGLCIWNLENMSLIEKISVKEQITCVTQCQSGDIIFGTSNGNLQVVSHDTRTIVRVFSLGECRILSVSSCPSDEAYVCAVTHNGKCILVDLDGEKIVWCLDSIRALSCCFAKAGDNSQLAIGCQGGVLTVLDAFDREWTRRDLVFESQCFISVVARGHWAFTMSSSGEIVSWSLLLASEPPQCVAQRCDESAGITVHPHEPMFAYRSRKGTIKIVDGIRHQTVSKIKGHGSTVRLAFSLHNPFLFVTATSDAVIRLWSVDYLFIRRLFSGGTDDRDMSLRPFEGSCELKELFSRVAWGREPSASSAFRPHIADLVWMSETRALSMVCGEAHRETSVLKRARVKSKEQMVMAAEKELRAGNIKKACELLFSAGEYDKSLGMAPSVSYEFWQNLMQKRAEVCQSPNDKAKALVLAGKYDEAVEVLVNARMFSSALLVAATKRIKQPLRVKTVGTSKSTEKAKPFSLINNTFSDDMDYYTYLVAKKEASFYLSQSKVYKAAAAFLSIGDISSAFFTLLRNGELYAAWIFGKTFQIENEKIARIFLLLRGFSTEAYLEVSKDLRAKLVIARRLEDEEEWNRFLKDIDLEDISNFINDDMGPPIVQKMHKLCLTCDYPTAIDVGLKELKENLKKPAWDFNYCQAICRELELIPSGVACVRAEILVYSMYLGAYDAMWKGYRGAFSTLLMTADKVARASELKFALDLLSHLKDNAKLATRSAVQIVTHVTEDLDTCGDGSGNVTMPRALALSIFDCVSFLTDGSGNQFLVW